MKVTVLKLAGQLGFRAIGTTFEAHPNLAQNFIERGWVEATVKQGEPLLENLTKKEILKKYSWFTEEDYVEAKKQKTKKDLITFVLKTEKLYD